MLMDTLYLSGSTGCRGHFRTNLSPSQQGCSGLYGNSYLSIRPTALKSVPAISRPIVGHNEQDVFAGLAEGSRGRSGPAHATAARFHSCEFHGRFRIAEGADARSAELAPRRDHRWSHRWFRTQKRL